MSISHIRHINYSHNAVSWLILTLGLLLSVYLSIIIPIEILLWLLIILLGYIFLKNTKHGKAYKGEDLLLLYLLTSICFVSFALLTHFVLVHNPDTDTFLTIDSFTFNDVGKDVSDNNWNNFVPFILSQYLYVDFYLFSLILGSLYKLDYIFGGQNPLLLCKLLNVSAGALTIGLTYICSSHLIDKIKIKPFVWFLLFSPLMENSAVLMRDIYVCFFYILIFNYIVAKEVKHRNIKIIILCLLCLMIRPANGIFAFGFLGLEFLQNWNKFSSKKRFVLGLVFAIVCIVAFIIVFPIAQRLLSSYQDRDLGNANAGSFGAKLKSLPIPFNFLIPAIFSQIMPFPLWFNLTRLYGGEYTILSVITPFYWLGIWTIICYAIMSKYKLIFRKEKLLVYGLIFASLYIIMTSYGEVNVRRIMGVYPIIFVIYLVIKNYVSFINRIKLEQLSTACLLILNAIYLFIK